MKPSADSKPIVYPKWIVCIPHATSQRWRVLPSRKAQREFAKANAGIKFELRRSRS